MVVVCVDIEKRGGEVVITFFCCVIKGRYAGMQLFFIIHPTYMY